MNSPAKALIVDDEPYVRMVIASLLEGCGYATECAGDGAQALELIAAAAPDIVFTDLNMPGMGGLELIARLKDLSPDIPIVVVSGTGDMQSAIEAIRRGAWEYIIKPVGLDALRHVATRSMERARLIRENRSYQERLEELVMERTRDLRDSEIRYRTLFENANDGIILIESGLISSCNRKAAEMFGLSRELVIGQSPVVLFPSGHATSAAGGLNFEHYQQTALQGTAQFCEWHVCQPDGGCLEIEISLNMLDLQGSPHLLAVMRDVTERKKAAAVLLENAGIRRELDMAHEIQRSLLPLAPPAIPGFDLACCCMPAASVGGDYFDFFDVAPGITDILIADVAGHSLGSALLMTEARTVLQARADISSPPARLLATLNDLLHDDLSRAELQLSAFAVRLDAAGGLFSYASGGHARPLLYQRATGCVRELDAEGLLLGVSRDVEFEECHDRLEAGDVLMLLTDGLTEAESPSGEFFGTGRLMQLLAGVACLAAEGILQVVLGELAQFTGSTQQRDDVTLVVIKAV